MNRHPNTAAVKTAIKTALSQFCGDDFAPVSVKLLEAMGYHSDRTPGGQTGKTDDFIDAFPARKNPNIRSKQEFRENAQSVHIIFQLTDDEIADKAHSQTNDFDKGNINSFLFAAVELKRNSYPRGSYAQFTREINKRLLMPTVVLFKTPNNLLTLAFAPRRVDKRDKNRDVIGRVSLVREIDLQNPHRAHLDILGDLSLGRQLQWMSTNNQPCNFDNLLEAWLDALDTEELNKRFYKDLFAWFERAVKQAKFPKALPPEQQVIRLITRILFIWFIKEKQLVAKEWFQRDAMEKLLHNFGESDYYRAILQNLFFATLNTEIPQRGFSPQKPKGHRVFSQYRYRSLIANKKQFISWMKLSPFINGGLFDCLDSEEAFRKGGKRIDMFSDPDPIKYRTARRKAWKALNVPDRLFFDEQYGLFPLLNRYKFTVEENTPVDQEVALDPELLGKVFENLLAAHNPETRETARKQTGSYYTPRDVVDYMVDEVLIESLAQKSGLKGKDGKSGRKRLRDLLDYKLNYKRDSNGDKDGFTKDETKKVVEAIADIKVLDPAVGSGAFPMGILHKLTLALRRLDPKNQHWEKLQRDRAGQQAEAAFHTNNKKERDEKLDEISEIFEHYRDSDFGRKLYLIQSSIYGVDIQPIACQIAKLRFFISLAIEQERDREADNFGIKPLPNLETRFVAADTLLGLEKPKQREIGETPRVKNLERELSANRERHFHATTYHTKMKYRDEDERLRGKLAAELQTLGSTAATAEKVAHWDPYDQNAQADWFDAKYMFGITDGFDIVMGNPPYIQLQKDGGKMGKRYKDAGFATFASTGDIYQLFYEKSCDLLAPKHSLLSYITSNSWLKAEYGKSTRRHLAERYTPLRLLEMGKDVFKNAIVDTSILIARSSKSSKAGKAVDMDRLPSKHFPPAENNWIDFRPKGEKPWSVLSATERSIMDKMEAVGTPLKEWDISINYGIKTGYNEAFIIDNQTKEALIAADAKSAEIIKPILRGRDIQRYQVQWADLWLIDSHNGYDDVPAINIDDYPAVKCHLDAFYPKLEKRQDKGKTPYNLRNCAYHRDFVKEKLFWMDMSSSGRFAYSETLMYCNNKGFIMTGDSLKYLCAILNSALITWFIKATARTTGVGLIQWEKFSLERLPIPQVNTEGQRPFVQFVDSILSAKSNIQAADTKSVEVEINQLVYELYKLNKKEVNFLRSYSCS